MFKDFLQLKLGEKVAVFMAILGGIAWAVGMFLWLYPK